MAEKFPTVPLYLLLLYLFAASGISGFLCIYFHHDIMVSTTNSKAMFYVSLFLVNNIFATIATFIYWTVAERDEARQLNQYIERLSYRSKSHPDSQSCEYANNSKHYGMLVSYYDNVNYNEYDDVETPSLI